MTSEALSLAESLGLIESPAGVRVSSLSGGVSSDIWLVDTGVDRFVLKRPKGQLSVRSKWVVPLSRAKSEVDWLRVVGEYFPDNVPRVLAFDPNTFAMALSYFPPETHTNWKSDLMAGRVDVSAASELGRLMGKIHYTTAGRPDLPTLFDTGDLFYSLRVEPFLERTAAAIPEVATPVAEVIESLGTTTIALVHGDLSPKNILVDPTLGPTRPIVLDAECAVWGDPAFDVAFCLAHVALKSVHVHGATDQLIDMAREFRHSYLDTCGEEIGSGVSHRLSSLIPALLLARVVGGSPAGYLTAREEEKVIRAAVTSLVSGEPCGSLLHPEKGLSDSPW